MTSADGYEYSTMRGEVATLRGRLDEAIRKDRAEAEAFLTDVKRLLKHGFNYGSAASDFRNRGNALVAQAEQAMKAIERECDGPLKLNEPVPGKLEDDSLRWLRDSQTVMQLRSECEGLTNVRGWTGDSKNNYDAAVTVQKSALEELRGVMVSTAQSCTVGALLNRAIFMAIGQAAVAACGAVRWNASAGGDMYYLRTASAVPVLDALLQQVHRAMSGEVADDSAASLISQVQKTERMPNLLVKGFWPTGISAALVAPADTSRGVTSAGNDANMDVEAQIRVCLSGANL